MFEGRSVERELQDLRGRGALLAVGNPRGGPMDEPARLDTLDQEREDLAQEPGHVRRAVPERSGGVVLGPMEGPQRGVAEDEVHESLVLERGHPDLAVGGCEADPQPGRTVRFVLDLRELLEKAAEVVEEAIVSLTEARAGHAPGSGARGTFLSGGDFLAGLLEDFLPLFREVALGRGIHEGSLEVALRGVNEAEAAPAPFRCYIGRPGTRFPLAAEPLSRDDPGMIVRLPLPERPCA